MWVIALVAGIFLLLLILLVIPIDLTFSVEREGGFKLRARVGWMYGLIGRDIGGRGKKRRKETAEVHGAKKKTGRGIGKSILAALTTGGFPQELYGLVRDILRLLKIRELKASVRIGLGNSIDTGVLYTVLTPIMILVSTIPSADVRLEPDYEQESLQGYCKGDIRAVPIKLLKALAFFTFSMTTMRAARAMLRAHRLERRASF